MNESPILREAAENFSANPQPRCACVLLLDTSGSMHGARIDALNRGLKVFKEALMQNNLARKRVQVAIVTFDDNVEVIQDFVDAEQFNPPALKAPGSSTNMGSGIQKALDIIQARRTIYKNYGIQYYRPWLFLITDGFPTEQDSIVEQAARRVKEEEQGKKIVCYAVGVAGADMDRLEKIVSDPLPLEGLNFEELFKWLSASLTKVSESNPGDPVQRPLPEKWLRQE